MKKTLCLALALVLVLALFAGCTKSGSGSTDNGGSNQPAETNFTPNPPIDWPQYEASDVGQNILPFDQVVAVTKNLPLAGEKVTFSAWWPMMANTYITTYNDAASYQELENRTNIHIDFFQPSSTEVATSFPLMIASDDYADMIFYAENYTGGGDKAIEDGVYLRLNELVEQYAPNYKALREYTDDARKGSITSKGNMWAFFSICMEHMPGYMGLNIRQDFLDRMGYEGRPSTISEWDEVLGRLLNEIDETEYAICIPPTGVTRYSAFASAYGVGSDWYQVDGKVKYGPVEAGFRNYIELMRDWYSKGYLRTDFYAVAPQDYNFGITWEEYGKGLCGAADGSNTFGNMLARYGDENSNGVAVRQPVLNAGDEAHIRHEQGVIHVNQLAITTACKNPELLTQWVDYRYTYDGYKLLYYGIEGLTYIEDQPHHILITENIINNEEGASPQMYLMQKFAPGSLDMGVSDYTNGWCFLDPRYATEILVWGQDKCDWNYPSNLELLTAEDAAEYAALYSDIETYINETVPKLIMGSISMDKYDDFVNQIKTMGIDRCIELKQAALDDYNNR